MSEYALAALAAAVILACIVGLTVWRKSKSSGGASGGGGRPGDGDNLHHK